MQRYLTELSSYLPSVSSFEFGNVFSILFDSVYGGPAPRPDAHDVGRAGSGTPRAGAFTGRQAVRSMKATRRAAAIGRMRVRRVCVGWGATQRWRRSGRPAICAVIGKMSMSLSSFCSYLGT